MKIMEQVRSGFTFFDGGCGTILQAAGLQPGELPEKWNITHADVIRRMHDDYLLAGVHILKTNTFGANSMKFGADGEFCLDAVVGAAVENARAAIRAAERGTAPDGTAADAALFCGVAAEHFVALDIGPLGKLLKPLGDLDFEDAYAVFRQTVDAGVKAGVDLILIETMNDIYEAKAAVLAAKEAGLPVFLTTAYDESHKLLTGADPRTVVAVAEGLKVDALGVNCSLGPEEMMGIVDELAAYASVPVIVNPNAGLPRTENGKTVYDVTPELFQASMKKIAEKGARVLGGCCGTTPPHIAAMIRTVKEMSPLPITEKTHTLIASYTHAVEFGKKPVLIGERINPTGKKKFKEALRAHDMDYILQQGLVQQDQHADVLDVNVGLPEIDEPAMMEEVIGELQAVSDLPLQIDTTDTAAMEKALRRYNGKAMINSVNGKTEVMEAVFPLAAKYGGLVVALTIDEDGIPPTAEDRVAIAERIYAKAAEYGIGKKDIIIDPLAMSISAEPDSAKVTLKALRLIRERLGGLTSLGVSNISFGLPGRELVNAAFFTMAMQSGLSAAIMNPGSAEMMKSYYTYCALQALDDNCGAYIAFAAGYAAQAAAAPAKETQVQAPAGSSDIYAQIEEPAGRPLVEAIVKGLKERAGLLCGELLENGMESLRIIDGALIPALDIVGKGFEKKTVFLPQLLMSAEAASAAFDVIRARMRDSGAEQEIKGRLILATVKGDIHDIGKNIVKVLLENYGYDVLDLGRDVAPERIVETAKREDIHLVGLSALMTTTVPAMEETIRQLRAEWPE
ncbi:MAG: homocysteine S-methyltransferase family protein, partial [Lachnospiraceae bacterium]|nr:homocysteine S-methyltransferase family protein [Lachnospiraceae bacterium]